MRFFFFWRRARIEAAEARAATQKLYDDLKSDLANATIRADATLERLKQKSKEAKPAVKLVVIK